MTVSARAQGDSSSSSSSSSAHRKYDVFLSFRGEDTRKGFSDHLYKKLKWVGLETFRDEEELESGESISPELLSAIESSKLAIVILSRNYASSTWCLEELVQIIKCKKEIGQIVLPIFYDVDPSDVRKQKGRFAEAFAKHGCNFRDDMEKVHRWRETLTEVANLKGWTSKDRYESVVVDDIVKAVWTKVSPTLITSVGEEVIGMDSKMQELESLLDTGSSCVQFLGIWGMGGMGKTTIARAVYDKIGHKFEVRCFIANIREVSQTDIGLVHVQKQLLSKIFTKKYDLWNVDEGTKMIQKVLCNKKVLLVLDDVDHMDQLKALVGNQHWFGFGSRIIITTRNVNLLISHGIEQRYMVNKLDDNEALRLLCLNAFKKNYPEDDYWDVALRVTKISGGLPLALKVLGSFLCGRGLDAWKSEVDKLQQVPDRNIFEILKVSYDGLDWTEKEIFLDIACFFKGKDRERVMEILDSCDFHSKIGIEILIEKSLITVSDNKLWMHDLLEDMGREIVRLDDCQNPGKRSRLCFRKDVIQVLTKNLGTKEIQTIFSKLPREKLINCSAGVFSRMHHLRLLNIQNVQFPQGLEYLPTDLRFLKWSHCPLEFLPLSSQSNELIELHTCHSNLKYLWKGIKHLDKLKYIKLNYSQNLLKTPDFTRAPNLENLDLEGCTNLVEIHPSIGLAKKLVVLNLKYCKNLSNLPHCIEMEALRIFILSGCSKINKIPEFGGNMENLLELHLDETSIRKLPLSIERLIGLTLLNLSDCNNLSSLPSVVSNLKSLQYLNLSGCSRLGNLPEDLGNIACLEELDVSETAVIEPPSSIVLLKNLRVLSFRGSRSSLQKSTNTFLTFKPQKLPDSRGLVISSLSGLHSLTNLDLSDCNLGTIPDGLNTLSSLTKLVLSGNNFVFLPESISQLSKLEELRVENCKKLLLLPELPSNIEFIRAEGCISLESLPDTSKLRNSDGPSFYCINCFQLADSQGYNSMAYTLLKRYLQGVSYLRSRFDILIPGSEIPQWFNHRSEDYSVVVELPSNFSTSTCVGFAFSVVFTLNDYLRESIRHDPSVSYTLHCSLIVNGEDELYPAPGITLDEESKLVKSDHIWLCYLPRHEYFFTGWQKLCNRVEFSFAKSGPSVEVKKCGVRLVYKVNSENFSLAVNHCSSSSSSMDSNLM